MSTDKTKETGTGRTKDAWQPNKFLTNNMISSQGGKPLAAHAKDMKAIDPHADAHLQKESEKLAKAGIPLVPAFPPTGPSDHTTTVSTAHVQPLPGVVPHSGTPDHTGGHGSDVSGPGHAAVSHGQASGPSASSSGTSKPDNKSKVVQRKNGKDGNGSGSGSGSGEGSPPKKVASGKKSS